MSLVHLLPYIFLINSLSIPAVVTAHNTCSYEAKQSENDVNSILSSCNSGEPNGPTLVNWKGGGWDEEEKSLYVDEGPCTIDRFHHKDLSAKQFIDEYAHTKPFVVQGASNNKIFQSLTQKARLLNSYGSSTILLSSANSYSYDRQAITFQEYCQKHMKAQSIKTLANETFYFFGDNGNKDWENLMDAYVHPPYHLPGNSPQLSFGVAGSGSGVPFHFHGPGFAETLWGRKRWFMYEPHLRPIFHPNRTTLQWLHEDYPQMKDDPHMSECTLYPGEIIYFPDHWWHATLNLDASVFMSTFLSP